VKIPSTASSVKNVKVVFLHGVNVNLQRSTAHLDLQDLLAQLVNLDNLVPLDLVVMMVNLDKLQPLAQLKIPHASNAPLEQLVHPAQMDLQVPLAQMVNPEHLELEVELVLLALLAHLEMLDQTETPVPLDNLDQKETMELVELVPPDQKVHQVDPEPQVLQDQMATPEPPETMVHQVQLAPPETQVPLVAMDNPVPLEVQVFLAQMPHIVLAHLVQLSSSAVVLKQLVLENVLIIFDHNTPLTFIFKKIIQVAPFYYYFCTPMKIKINGF
jgi:hypothetical protein